MRKLTPALHFLATFLFLIGFCLAPMHGRTQNRLIATGWDSPNPAAFRAGIAGFEKWPFDGATIFPTVKRANGSFVSNGFAFSREAWAADACAGMIADLQAVHSPVKAHSFLFCYANPGDVDWFDDAGWTQIVSHWRQLARAARMGGLRGLLFDAEPYTPPFEQFNDAKQAQTAKHTFAEYAAKARQRGRDVMRAIVGEYAGMTLFTYRLLSDLLPPTASGALPPGALSGNTYALLPAFVDGWLDAAPPTITIIEGNEAIGYRANNPATFDRAFAHLRTELPRLLDPAHEGKIRRQIQISHGLYLDAYINPPGSPWRLDLQGETPAARLEANVVSALHAADSGYLWIYGETGRWWPTRQGSTEYPLWPDKLTGADKALRQAKDPDGAARAFLQSAPTASNLLHNADFGMRNPNGLPAEWWTWQNDASHGQPSLAQAALCWSGASQAVWGQNVAVRPGTHYALGASLRQEGRGTALLVVRWKDAKGQWSNQSDDRLLWPSASEDKDGWRECCGLIVAPPGSAAMIVMFAANGQPDAQSRAQCRNLRCAAMP